MARAGDITVSLLMMTGSFETDSKRAEKRLRELQKTAVSAGKAIGAGIAVAGFAMAAGVKQAIDYADRMDEMAEKLGLSTERLSAWGYAAKQSGTDLDTLAGGLTKLNKNLAESLDPTSKQAELWASLGVATKDATGQLLSAEAVLPAVAERIQALDNAAIETKLAMELFGKSGAELLPLLNRGADGMEQLERRARELGIVIGGETAAAAGAFNDKLDDLQEISRGLFLEMAGKLLPSLDRFADTLQDPGIREGLGTIISGLATIADFALRASANVANFTRTVAEDLAASVHGIAADDLERQRRQIAGLQKMASDLENGGAMFGSKEGRQKRLAEVNADIKQLQAAYAANVDMFGPRVNVISPTRSDFGKVRPPTRADRLGGWDPSAVDRMLGGGSSGKTKALREAAKATEELTEFEKDLAAIEEIWSEAATENVIKLGDKTLATHQAQEAIDAQIGSMEFELKLMSMSAAEREKAIALRYAGADATDEQRAAIERLTEAMERERELVGFMDGFRADAADALKNLALDFDNAGQHIEDFFDGIADRITQMIAERWIEQLFGSMGSTGAGTSGGNMLGGFFGMIFGGGRAGGGDTMPGNAYLVGENGPEMFVPRTAGTVLTADQTAGFRGGNGRSFKQTLNVTIAGRPDKSTPEQIARASGREAARAMSRTGR